MPSVSVIIVTYNSASLIEGCLASLCTSASIAEVVVWDNNSNDAVAQVVQLATSSRDMPFDVLVREHDTNIGFARAVNSAVDLMSGDYLLLLNPDCIIDGAGVDSLVAQLEIDSDIGVIAPEIVHPSGRLRVKSAGFEPTSRHILSQALGLPQVISGSRGFNLYAKGQVGDTTDVDWVSGACMLMSSDQWQKLGGLSEKWFMYAEDIDLCRRVRSSKLRVVHYSGVEASHLVGASSEADRGPAWTLWLENLYDYYRINLCKGSLDKRLWKLSFLFTFLSRALVYRVRASLRGDSRIWMRESAKFIDYARAVVRLP